MWNLLTHVGSTHDKIEQFLDPSLHVPKGRIINHKTSDQESKSSDHECHLCQKRFSARYNLKMHQALCHFKEEFKQFIDEKQLKCNICHLKFANKSNLQIHVGVIHKKLDEVLQQSTPSSEQAAKQSLDQLDLDLDLSSDGEHEETEISQGDIKVENEEDKIEDQNEEENKREKNSRKRLRVSEKGDQDYSQAQKRKIVQEQDQATGRSNSPSDRNKDSSRSQAGDEVDKSSDSRDEIDDLLSDSD